MASFAASGFRLGVLGGGQLGRMMIQEAYNLDVDVEVLDGSAAAPCRSMTSRFVVGDIKDPDAVEAFGKGLDVLTIEIEDVSVEGMRRLEAAGVRCVPRPDHVELIQDKALQKDFFMSRGIPTAAFARCEGGAAGATAALESGFPLVHKVRRGGYDGKGVVVLRSADDAARKAFPGPCIAEALVDIELELSVVVARCADGTSVAYEAVEGVFDARANVLSYLISPANVSEAIRTEATALARRVVAELDFVGLLAVELFLDTSGNLLVNEIAPRAHNSGHHTIEANATSQFAQLLRVCLGVPLGDAAATRPVAATLNVLGDADTPAGPPTYRGLAELLGEPGIYPHLYGKAVVTPFRKMGHITIVGETREDVVAKVERIQRTLSVSAAKA
ncbi:hypothetical protein M885DRAFT_537783 [Pelagophyceae sp. CCMP2097]|nr:hypothetical protein M885DRAFT_537783 [Pelagophyceae sp. CCMP2097]